MNVRYLSYLAFISIGTVQGLVGAVIPQMMEELTLPYATAGLIVTGEALGNLCTVMVGGPLMDRFGKKPLLLIGGALIACGLFMPLLFPTFALILTSAVITGIGATLFDVGCNAIVMDGPEKGKGQALGLLHFFFGAGAFAGPFLAPLTAHLPGTFRTAFAFAAILPLLLIVLVLATPIHNLNTQERPEPASPKEVPRKKDKGPASSLWMWSAGVALFLYAQWELGMGSWISAWAAARATDSASFTGLIPPAAWTSLFWLSLTIGRLFMGKVADKIGFGRFLICSCLSGFFTALVWVFFPVPEVAFCASIALGLSAAGVFPTFMAIASSRFPGKSGTTVSFLFLFSGLGGMAVGPVIGSLADGWGIMNLTVFHGKAPGALGGIGIDVLPVAVAAAAGTMVIILWRIAGSWRTKSNN